MHTKFEQYGKILRFQTNREPCFWLNFSRDFKTASILSLASPLTGPIMRQHPLFEAAILLRFLAQRHLIFLSANCWAGI